MANLNQMKANAISKVTNKGFLAGSAFIGLNAVSEYSAYRDQGKSTMSAVGRTAAMSLFRYTNPVFSTVVEAVPEVYNAGVMANQFRRSKYDEQRMVRENRRTNQIGGGYVDSQHAVTMRQAAVQQIQGNKLNARSALGGEARLFSPFT